jgi:tetratricopeptide (TPR) repeat protein
LGLGLAWWWWSGQPERALADAERLLEEDLPDDALERLELAESTSRTRERAQLVRARVALARGRPGDAVEPLNSIDPNGPWAVDAAYWKGRTLYAAKQTVQAVAWFREAAAHRPDDPDIHRWLGAAAYDLGAREHAIEELKLVTRLDPDDARVWRTLGLIYNENAKHDEAVLAYERSLALDGSQPSVRLELADSCVAEGQLDEAERQLEHCRGKVPEAERAAIMAECRLLRGDLTGCRSLLESAVSAFPKHPGLMAQRARLELAGGRAGEALTWLDRALAADPYIGEWHHQRAGALRMLGRTAEADAAQARATELRRMSRELSGLNDEAARNVFDAGIRHRIGLICVGLGKPELAASWYVAALACDPNHAGARRDLAALNRSMSGQTYSFPP